MPSWSRPGTTSNGMSRVWRSRVSFGPSIRLGKIARVADVVERVGGRAPTPLADLVGSEG